MKITIYELLGMVKDGKAPKKIKYDNMIYELEYTGFCKEYQNKSDDRITVILDIDLDCLNDEVEILDEKKIPEKLPTWFSLEMSHNKEDNIEYANANFENMYEKINEICDYLKSKGE